MLLVRWMCLILFVTRCFTRIQHHTYKVKTTESPSVQGLRPQGETGPKSFTRCNLGVVTKPPYCWRCKRRGHWHSVQTITLKYLFFCRCQCIKIEKRWSARTCRDLPGPSSEKIKYQSSKLLFFFNSWAMKKAWEKNAVETNQSVRTILQSTMFQLLLQQLERRQSNWIKRVLTSCNEIKKKKR